MGKYTKALRNIYSSATLDDIATWAQSSEFSIFGDIEFTGIQKKIIEGNFEDFSFNFLTTSLIACDQSYLPIETDVICLNIDDELAKGYEKVAEFDEVSPLAYLNSGKLINSEKLRSLEEWHEHPIYKLHCKKFDIDRGLTISFRNMERLRTFLAFEYLGSSHSQSWINIEQHYLELASFPFALAWLYRKGIIDDAALQRRFFALADLTERQLTHIRKYVNSPSQSFQEQALDLKISEPWLKENLYETRNQLTSRLNWTHAKRRTSSTLRQLEHEFQFMKMLGDPTTPLQPLPGLY